MTAPVTARRGEVFPAFTLRDTDGSSIFLESYRGRTNLVVVFAGDKVDESPVAVLLEELVARREEFTLPARARLGTARRERDSRLARVHQHPVSRMRRARVAEVVERSIL